MMLKKNTEWSKKVLFSNPTQYDRRQYGSATVPFKIGEWFGDNTGIAQVTDGATVKPIPLYLRPFGTRYKDGSIMQAELLIPLEMNKWSESEITIKDVGYAAPGKTPFSFGKDLLSKLNTLKIKVGITLDGITWNTFTADNKFEIIEENLARVVLEYSRAIGDFVVFFRMYVYQGQDLIEYELSIFGSNPSIGTVVYPFEEIRFSIEGAFFDILGLKNKNVLPAIKSVLTEGQEVILLKNDPTKVDGYFGDGQGQTWIGNVYFQGENDEIELYGATMHPLWGVSQDLSDVKTFGLLSEIPKSPLTKSELRDFVIAKYVEYENILNSRGYAWDDNILGMTKVPSQAGFQDDIHLVKTLEVVSTGRPELLKHLVFFATEESMRPHHYFGTNLKLVTQETNPNWITWSQTTFDRISPDTLGKEKNQWKFAHDWEAQDDEHNINNLLSEVAYLVPRYFLIRELESDIAVYMAGHTLPSIRPGWSTNDSGVGRALQRTFTSMCKAAMVTGDNALIERLINRFDECVAPVWAGKNTTIRHPYRIVGPDARIMPNHRYTTPWQELLVPIGLEMLTRLLEFTREGDFSRIRDMAKIICFNSLKDGFKKTRDANGKLLDFKVGHGVRYFEDNPEQGILPEQYEDKDREYFVPADYLELWTIPAMELALKHYTGDNAAIEAAREMYDLYTSVRPYMAFDDIRYWQGI